MKDQRENIGIKRKKKHKKNIKLKLKKLRGEEMVTQEIKQEKEEADQEIETETEEAGLEMIKRIGIRTAKTAESEEINVIIRADLKRKRVDHQNATTKRNPMSIRNLKNHNRSLKKKKSD